jgi:2'-5' RNA ligase
MPVLYCSMIHRCILHNNFTSEVDEYHKRLVREVAQKFGLQKTLFQNIAAHFTLKYWFDADEGELAQLERMLNEFCAAYHPAPVLIGEIKGFPPEVVFMDIQLSPDAEEIFDSLIAKLKSIEWMAWDRFDAPNLHFHSTIAEECGPQYDEVLDYLASRHTGPLKASFDNITVTLQIGLIKKLPLLMPHGVFRLTGSL